MLDEKIENIMLAANVMVSFHMTNEVPANTPHWIYIDVAEQAVAMRYGYNGTLRGVLRFARGNFELTHVTNAQGNFVTFAGYKHDGNNSNQQDFINALSCNDLNSNPTLAAAIVTLTSESYRSEMVFAAICTLMDLAVPFDSNVQNGMEFAYNNYSTTCAYMEYKIQAGGHPWMPLIDDNYRDYIMSPGYTGNREQLTYLEAVENYINQNN